MVIPLLIVVVGLVVFVLFPTSPALRYEIRDGFRGWVVIQYGDPRCSPLPMHNGYLVLKISESGCLCTSTSLPEGLRTNAFEYVASDGHRTAIPAKYGDPTSQILEDVTGEYVTGNNTFVRSYFFVGPLHEYKRAPNITDVDKLICKELD